MKTQTKNSKIPYQLPQGGFTLIEILVASAIMVILAFGFLGIQYIISQNQISVWKNYMSMEAANTALSGLSKELRNAGQSDTGGYLIETTNDYELVFYSDIDFDGAAERVRYTLSGIQFVRGVTEPAGSPISYPLDTEKSKIITDIVRNGTTPIFYYYNSQWPMDTVNNPLALASRISDTALIKIIVRTNPKANDAENDYILESDIRLRMIF